MTREEHKKENTPEYQFLSKLAKLVTEYRTQVNLGAMVGALETVKMRLYLEADKELEEGHDKEDNSPWGCL